MRHLILSAILGAGRSLVTASSRLSLAPTTFKYQAEFARYKRFISDQRCLSILDLDDADEIIQGSNIYKIFAEIVDYSGRYRSLKKIVGLVKLEVSRYQLCQSSEGFDVEDSGETFSKSRKANASFRLNFRIRNIPKVKPEKKHQSVKPEIKSTVRTTLANVSGLKPEEIRDNVELADISIDLLMGIELSREVEIAFKCALLMENLIEVTDFPSFVDCIKSSLPTIEKGTAETDDNDDGNETEESTSEEKCRVDIVEYLVEILGVYVSDIHDDTLLVDIGVDSLLSTELRSDFSRKFETHIPEDISIEAITVEELKTKITPSFNIKKTTSLPENKPVIRILRTKDTTSISNSGKPPSSSATPKPTTRALSFTTSGGNLKIPTSTVLKAFREAKLRTNQLIRNYKINNFAKIIYLRSIQLYIALTLETFKKLGVSIKTAKPGHTLKRIHSSLGAKKAERWSAFLAHDIEKPVPAELIGTQHIVIVSNAVHATHDLVKSVSNIRNTLRLDGLLIMLEMTEIIPFIDFIFGLLEGFGHVDYSDGYLPENEIQKVIIALTCGPTYTRLLIPEKSAPKNELNDLTTRENEISTYVQRFSADFDAPTATPQTAPLPTDGQCVLVTGASGLSVIDRHCFRLAGRWHMFGGVRAFHDFLPQRVALVLLVLLFLCWYLEAQILRRRPIRLLDKVDNF
ncbi:hypothetical protein BDR22DRAFT_825707 [Usnea florida]